MAATCIEVLRILSDSSHPVHGFEPTNRLGIPSELL